MVRQKCIKLNENHMIRLLKCWIKWFHKFHQQKKKVYFPVFHTSSARWKLLSRIYNKVVAIIHGSSLDSVNRVQFQPNKFYPCLFELFGRFFFARLCRIIQQECAKFWAKCLFSISCTTLCTHKLIPQMKFDSRIRPLEHTALQAFNIEHGVTMVVQHAHIVQTKLHFENHIYILTCASLLLKWWMFFVSIQKWIKLLLRLYTQLHLKATRKKRAIQSSAEFRKSDCFLAISIWNHIQFIGFPECYSFHSFFSCVFFREWKKLALENLKIFFGIRAWPTSYFPWWKKKLAVNHSNVAYA